MTTIDNDPWNIHDIYGAGPIDDPAGDPDYDVYKGVDGYLALETPRDRWDYLDDITGILKPRLEYLLAYCDDYNLNPSDLSTKEARKLLDRLDELHGYVLPNPEKYAAELKRISDIVERIHRQVDKHKEMVLNTDEFDGEDDPYYDDGEDVNW